MHHPKHIPFKGGRGGIEIGLKPINEGNWLEIDHLFEAELKLKKALLQDKKDVVLVSNNDYLDTERELLELQLLWFPQMTTRKNILSQTKKLIQKQSLFKF